MKHIKQAIPEKKLFSAFLTLCAVLFMSGCVIYQPAPKADSCDDIEAGKCKASCKKYSDRKLQIEGQYKKTPVGLWRHFDSNENVKTLTYYKPDNRFYELQYHPGGMLRTYSEGKIDFNRDKPDRMYYFTRNWNIRGCLMMPDWPSEAYKNFDIEHCVAAERGWSIPEHHPVVYATKIGNEYYIHLFIMPEKRRDKTVKDSLEIYFFTVKKDDAKYRIVADRIFPEQYLKITDFRFEKDVLRLDCTLSSRLEPTNTLSLCIMTEQGLIDNLKPGKPLQRKSLEAKKK